MIRGPLSLAFGVAAAILSTGFGAATPGGAPTGSTVGLPVGVETRTPHEAGAPPGRAGAPGESSCYECHNDLPLNEPEGRLVLFGVPQAWEPGAPYVLTLILESEGMVRAGFQATASDGALRPVDGRVASVPDSLGRSYVGHAPGRTNPDSSERTVWTMEWVAPAEGAAVLRIHAAANSANGDNSPLGDFVYTTSAEVPPASPAGP
ncbi:MAG: hypothetical protein HKO53_12485 [Gemmatimonadetes bacterium]|nr:hypothetical protein [Gemmatimonadota bacterium]